MGVQTRIIMEKAMLAHTSLGERSVSVMVARKVRGHPKRNLANFVDAKKVQAGHRRRKKEPKKLAKKIVWESGGSLVLLELACPHCAFVVLWLFASGAKSQSRLAVVLP